MVTLFFTLLNLSFTSPISLQYDTNVVRLEIVQSWIDTVLKELKCLDDQNFLFYFYTQKYGYVAKTSHSYYYYSLSA